MDKVIAIEFREIIKANGNPTLSEKFFDEIDRAWENIDWNAEIKNPILTIINRFEDKNQGKLYAVNRIFPVMFLKLPNNNNIKAQARAFNLSLKTEILDLLTQQ